MRNIEPPRQVCLRSCAGEQVLSTYRSSGAWRASHSVPCRLHSVWSVCGLRSCARPMVTAEGLLGMQSVPPSGMVSALPAGVLWAPAPPIQTITFNSVENWEYLDSGGNLIQLSGQDVSQPGHCITVSGQPGIDAEAVSTFPTSSFTPPFTTR
jgi:hypothetical protein